MHASAAHLLKVGGLTPFTSIDYPGKLAAVVFVQGCPWRCGYCHNPHLQRRDREGALPWPQLLSLFQRRAGLIDAVVFSGGEPTADPALGDAIRQVRDLGLRAGLHTAGTHPARLKEVLPLLDWVGMDVKAPFADPDRYRRITGIRDSGRCALASARMLLDSGVAHEFRTTIHPALLSDGDIVELAEALAAMGAGRYALQVFRVVGCAPSQLWPADLDRYPCTRTIERMKALFREFTLRRT